MTISRDRIYSIVILILLGVVCLQAYNIYNKNNIIHQQQLLIESLQDSIQVMESDILYAIDLIDNLEDRRDSIKVQLEEEKLKKQIERIVVQQDTIVVTPDGRNIEEGYEIPIRQDEWLTGGVYRLDGTLRFKWDYMNNRPYEPKFTVDDVLINLNVRVKLEEVTTGYEVEVTSPSKFVKVTWAENNLLKAEEFVRRAPSKVSFGIHSGFGLTNQGFTPYIGIGVTYNFVDLTEILKDKKIKFLKANGDRLFNKRKNNRRS